jgi:hypothetical protein
MEVVIFLSNVYKYLEFRYFCKYLLIQFFFFFNIFSIFDCFLFSASAKNKVLQIMCSCVFSLHRGQFSGQIIEMAIHDTV